MKRITLILTVLILFSINVLGDSSEECIFSAESSTDLSSIGLTDNENAIHVKCNTPNTELDTGELVDELWILKNGKVYFNKESGISYLDQIDPEETILTIGELKEYTMEIKLSEGFMEIFLLNNYIDEEIILSFSFKEENIVSLGTKKNLPEGYEVTWWNNEFEDYEEAGLQEQDVVLTSETIIKNPKENSMNDQFVLKLTSKEKEDYKAEQDTTTEPPEETEGEEEPTDEIEYEEEGDVVEEDYEEEGDVVEEDYEEKRIFVCNYPQCKHPSKDQCLSEGIRLGVVYCEEGKWNLAKQEEEACTNNYQCLDQLCKGGICKTINPLSPADKKSFFRRVLCWLINPLNVDERTACE